MKIYILSVKESNGLTFTLGAFTDEKNVKEFEKYINETYHNEILMYGLYTKIEVIENLNVLKLDNFKKFIRR